MPARRKKAGKGVAEDVARDVRKGVKAVIDEAKAYVRQKRLVSNALDTVGRIPGNVARLRGYGRKKRSNKRGKGPILGAIGGGVLGGIGSLVGTTLGGMIPGFGRRKRRLRGRGPLLSEQEKVMVV